MKYELIKRDVTIKKKYIVIDGEEIDRDILFEVLDALNFGPIYIYDEDVQRVLLNHKVIYVISGISSSDDNFDQFCEDVEFSR